MPQSVSAPRDHREKTEHEFDIEARWRESLLGGASTEDFQHAYDELHAEFMDRQHGDADLYEKVNPRSSTEDRIRAVLLQVIGSGQDVLEVGTGDGRTACLLAEQGNKVTSVDVSRLALAQARERWGDLGLDLSFRFGDARALEFESETFDFCISENMVEHISLEDMRAHLQEVKRLLNPGGSYLIYTPSRLWSGRVSVGFHLHVYTLREMCALLREYGFETVWLEPRFLHRFGRIYPMSGLGLRLACLWEDMLSLLRVHRWPVKLRSKVLPSLMVRAIREETANG